MSTASTSHSAIYEGRVRHQRHRPKVSRFQYTMFMVYLDLDELDEAADDDIPYFLRQELAQTPHAPVGLTWTADGHFRTPDLRGLSLRDTYSVFQGSGLALLTTGTGQVISQDPAAGSIIQPGDQVEVVLQ